MDKNLIQRLLSGAVYGLIVILCTHPIGSHLLRNLFPGIMQYQMYYVLIAFFMLLAVWECIRIMQFNKGWEKFAALPVALLVFYRFSKKYFEHGFYFDFNLSEILGLSLILIAIVTLFLFSEELEYNSGKLIFTVIYASLTFSYALALPYFNTENEFTLEPFFLFILIWSSDSFAFFAGKLFGKHKMAPSISPKKTWEGFAGGVLLTLIFSFCIERQFPELRGNWIITGFLVAVFAPLGDLVESQLKRQFGVKDSGNIIPGHGGILDRLDSFIICAPVVYLYFIIDKLI